MIDSKSKLIFYLDRQKLIIAGTKLASPVTLEFPANIVYDIDISDPESFDLLLARFFEQSKIPSSDILMVISPEVYYEKNIALSTDPAQRQSQIDQFLEAVPFKNLTIKDYSIANQPKLIAINKNFYEPIIRFIKRNGYNVSAILPFFILENFQLKLTDYLPKEVKDIYQKYKILEPFSLFSTQDIDKMVATIGHHPKEDNSRALILLIVFCFLFVVLLFFIFIRPMIFKPAPVKIAPAIPVAKTTQILPSPTADFIATDVLRIKITNGSGVSNQAADIKQALITVGFKQITTSSSSVISAANSQITFSPRVSPYSRQKIKEAVEKLTGVTVVTESIEITDTDVLITTTFKPKN